ncbi:MAG: hypothetical protein EPN22_12635 [Nitrospirae bacterium]|nr:MAG: hypothetical protein EPN22_12635 [Nitrospirota bacterium]
MSFNGKLEDLMSAITFAEVGEFETAKETLKGEKRVLLAVRENNLGDKTSRYAVNTCKRIGAELDILYVSSEGTVSAAIERLTEELEKEAIGFRIVKKTGCLKQRIIDYTGEKSDIQFVITESSDSLDVDCKTKKQSDAWKNLRCPLVVVANAGPA